MSFPTDLHCCNLLVFVSCIQFVVYSVIIMICCTCISATTSTFNLVEEPTKQQVLQQHPADFFIEEELIELLENEREHLSKLLLCIIVFILL